MFDRVLAMQCEKSKDMRDPGNATITKHGLLEAPNEGDETKMTKQALVQIMLFACTYIYRQKCTDNPLRF